MKLRGLEIRTILICIVTASVPSRGVETNRLADTLCLLAKQLQLRLHEFGLNSNDVIEILSVSQFLNELIRDSEVSPHCF